MLPRPGGDEPRFLFPPSAGDKLIEHVSAVELQLHRGMADDFGQPTPVEAQLKVTSEVPAADVAALIAALSRSLQRPVPAPPGDAADDAEGGAL